MPAGANPIEELRNLDLHRTLNVEDFFVKSAALVASLRALSIESASLAARLYGLKLEIDELERQKMELTKYLGEPTPDPADLTAETLANAMVKDAVSARQHAELEIDVMNARVADLRTQGRQYHTIGEQHGYADRATSYQRNITLAGNWESTGARFQADYRMEVEGGGAYTDVRDKAGEAAYQLAAFEHYERLFQLTKDAEALESSVKAANALEQTYENNVARAKYNRDMVFSRFGAIEMLLKSRRALYSGKRGDPTNPEYPFDPTCPDDIDILGRLHAVSVRYAHERRLLRTYLVALLHAYRQVYAGKASPAVITEWGRLLQTEEFFDHADEVYLLLNEFELLHQRLAANARRTFVVREVTLPSLPNALNVSFDDAELQDYPLARIRGLSAALLADDGRLGVFFNTRRRKVQGLRSGEIPLVLPLALQPSPPVFATNDFWNEPLDNEWEIQVRSYSGPVGAPVQLLICWHLERGGPVCLDRKRSLISGTLPVVVD